MEHQTWYDKLNRTYITFDIPYIVSQYIREYDISKANINILLYKGMIDESQYNFLYNSDRMTRQITIGKMIANNNEIGEIIKNGIHEMVSKFIYYNNLEEQDILSIKNDAIFVLNKIPTITKFENVEFKNKNTYTSYININGIEVYYCIDKISNIENIEIKGINEDKLKIHAEFFIDFLCEYFYNIENQVPEDIMKWFKKFYNDYISLSLDEHYYITFNSNSTLVTNTIGHYKYEINMSNNLCRDIIDISYNLNILRILYRYLLELYFGRR